MSDAVRNKIETESAKPKRKANKVIIKKVKKGDHGGHHGGSWKVAYADFVTAMMAFFLLMWLLSMTDPDTKKQIAAFFQDEQAPTKAHHLGKGDEAKAVPAERIGVPDIKLNSMEKIQYSMITKLKDFLESVPELRKTGEAMANGKGVTLQIPSDLIFEQGQTTLKPEARVTLDFVAQMLREFNFDLVIRGHTDDAEPASKIFPSNWELSASRAASALRYMTQDGKIAVNRLRAIGYADSQPIAPNVSPENRAKNRRVEFFYHRPDQPGY